MKLRRDNTSGFTGVSRCGSKWMAYRYEIYLGIFNTPEEAAAAYDSAQMPRPPKRPHRWQFHGLVTRKK